MSKKVSKREKRRIKRENGIKLAICEFEKRGICYKLCCADNGHFHIWNENGKLYQYWASTDRIMSRKEVGLDKLLEIVKLNEKR